MTPDMLHEHATLDARKRATRRKARRVPHGGHWHVLVGLRGCYMPDTNDVYRTRRDAERGARWWAEQCRDDGETKVRGSARAGYYTVGEHNQIEVVHCTVDGCMEGES